MSTSEVAEHQCVVLELDLNDTCNDTRCFDEDSNILNTVNDGVPVCPGGSGGAR